MGKLAEAYIEINAQTKGMDDGLKSAEARLESFVGKARSLVGVAVGGAAVGGLVRFFLDAAQAGSDLGETMSKTAQVFGGATSRITAMADDMAAKFGAVKKTTLDAAAMFGLIAEGAGMSESASAGLAEQLTRLADDASSFYNVPLDVALEKIRAGLVGESEPLRAFGVMLSDAAVQAKALQLGYKGVGNELTEAEKVMTRVKLIQEGLTKATGDHERTLGSYANQVRLLRGELENLKADLGAPIAGGLALLLQSLRGGGFFPDYDNGQVPRKDVSKLTLQGMADRNAGVVAGGITPYRGLHLADLGSGFGGLGITGLPGPIMNAMVTHAPRGVSLADLGSGFAGMGIAGLLPQAMDAQIQGMTRRADLRDQMFGGRWSGGMGQMGMDDFMRSAQSTILQKGEGREQIEHLKAMRDALFKIRDNTTPRPSEKLAAVMVGRE